MATPANNQHDPSQEHKASGLVGEEKEVTKLELETRDAGGYAASYTLDGQPVLKSRFDELTIRETAWEFRWAVFYSLIAAVSALCDGYQINLNGGIIANKGFIKQFGTVFTGGKQALDTNYVAAWGGIQSAGQVLGMCTLNFLSDALGRKAAFYTLLLILIISLIIESVSTHWWHWLIAKLFSGVGVGMLQSTAPVYISELAPLKVKGVLINLYSIFFTVGQFIAPVILQHLNKVKPFDWKTAIYTQWAFMGTMIALYLVLPESPWWLVSKGKHDKAAALLRRMNGHVQGYDADREIAVMDAVIEEERRLAAELKEEGFLTIFKGLNGKRTIIAAFPKMLQQLTGLTLVNTYATYFFQLAGNKDPFLVTVILVVIQVVTVIAVCFVTDTHGRRDVVVWGFSGASIAVLCIGIIGLLDYKSKSLGSLLIFFAAIVMSLNTGAGALGYAILAEVPTQRWRARTAGFGAAMAASLGACFGTSVPYMLKKQGHTGAGWGVKTGFFFGCTGIIGSIIAFFIIPETSRRSPAEMDELFNKRVPLRKFKGYVTDVQRNLQAHEGQREGAMPA